MTKILKKMWHLTIAMSLLRSIKAMLDSMCALLHIDVDHHVIKINDDIIISWTPYQILESFVALIFHKN